MAGSHESAWAIFLKKVDDDEPEEDVLKKTETFLTKLFPSPGKAYVVRLEALPKHADFPDCLSTQAFLAWAIGTVEVLKRLYNHPK